MYMYFMCRTKHENGKQTDADTHNTQPHVPDVEHAGNL